VIPDNRSEELQKLSVVSNSPIRQKVFVDILTFREKTGFILVKGYFVTVIASVSQRSNPLKIKRLLRQKAPRNDAHSNPKRV
jgi:hypothetical protein